MKEDNVVYPVGIKWTKQRKDVYHILMEAESPLSAVQIYNRIEKEQADVSYAVSTIYRILAAFEEKDLVTKTTWMGTGTVVYEINRGGHTHYAVCLSCRKRVPLPTCPFEHAHLDTTSGDFTITGHKLELFGYCKACESQNE